MKLRAERHLGEIVLSCDFLNLFTVVTKMEILQMAFVLLNFRLQLKYKLPFHKYGTIYNSHNIRNTHILHLFGRNGLSLMGILLAVFFPRGTPSNPCLCTRILKIITGTINTIVTRASQGWVGGEDSPIMRIMATLSRSGTCPGQAGRAACKSPRLCFYPSRKNVLSYFQMPAAEAITMIAPFLQTVALNEALYEVNQPSHHSPGALAALV